MNYLESLNAEVNAITVRKLPQHVHAGMNSHDTIKAEVNDIASRILHNVGKSCEVPGHHRWILYDPCMTTKWRNAHTASRFQEFLKQKQKEEQRDPQKKRQISAVRRRELLEMRRADTGGSGVLVDKIAKLFAAGLLNELRVAYGKENVDGWEVLDCGVEAPPSSLGGLFAKWAPTPDGMHDRALGIAPLIRKRLLEKLREERNDDIREEVLRAAVERVREDKLPLEHLSYQRDILTPLRRMAQIPEHFIGAGTAMGGVNYHRMASRCRMIFGEKVFRRLDEENYDRFLVSAAKDTLLRIIGEDYDGKIVKVNVGALAPHEVMLRAVKADAAMSSIAKVEAGLQWEALVESCARQASKGETSAKRLIIPMCDVSGSMDCPCDNGGHESATCMDVACALSLLLTDCLPEDNAFYGKILTFSSSPEFVDLRPKQKSALTIKAIKEAESLDDIASLIPDLAGRVYKLKQSPWGGSTNLFGAMKRICEIAWHNNLTADDIKGLELVIFSDMGFNQAQYGARWDEKTMLEKIRQLFVDRFGPSAAANPPKIVFWNLRASTSGSGVAEDAEEDGVVLLSGLSSGLIRKYLSWDLGLSGAKKDGETGESAINPMKAMLACLEDPLYETLRLEKDLREWEVLVSEEEVMKRAEKISGENMELVHASNSSALVAFFFEAVPGIGADGLEELLESAFKENPMIALRLLFNLGSVRKHAAGKADRENFQLALLWLWRNWPETYLLNVGCIAKFTSLKELLNSAMFILYEGEHDRDPENYALFSLVGQKMALQEHKWRQKHFDDRARRHRKKERRLELWSEFAQGEERKLFGDLRVEVEWDGLKEKLCIKGRRMSSSRHIWDKTMKESIEQEDDYYDYLLRAASPKGRCWKRKEKRNHPTRGAGGRKKSRHEKSLRAKTGSKTKGAREWRERIFYYS